MRETLIFLKMCVCGCVFLGASQAGNYPEYAKKYFIR